MSDAAGGPRLAELLLAELVGRDLGPLAAVRVDGLDHPAHFACAAGETYAVEAGGIALATVAVRPEAVEIASEPDGPTVRFESGDRIKAALDEIATWAAQTGQQDAT
ncbi:MAG: hypothetical protein ACLFMX_06785 [Halobacteriales archaeon]